MRLLKADSGGEGDVIDEGDELSSPVQRVLASAFVECTRVSYITLRRRVQQIDPGSHGTPFVQNPEGVLCGSCVFCVFAIVQRAL